MNSWNQSQQQTYNNIIGQQQFSPYVGYNWNTQSRAPVYKAEPIHGENAAWAFPIGGGDIWLPDADKDIIWWIRVDQNGNKQVLPFDVKPHEEPKQADMNEILARLGALEEWVNGKQNKSNAKRNATNNATTIAGTNSAESVN